jgi:ubiquinone/menaquinone biosynthesis C-methylase UbiE
MLGLLKIAYSRIPIFIRVMQISSIRQFLQFKENSINVDVGCGDGWISKKITRLLPSCATLYSVDWNKSDYMYIQESNFIKTDIHKLPFKDSSVDSILLSSVLQVVPNDTRLLKEMHRVISDDGYMVLTVPTGYPIIEKLMKNKLCSNIINSIKQRKISYQIFKDETNKLYSIVGKGFYNVEQVISLLKDNGFKVVEYKKSPGVVGALIFQYLIFIRYILGMKRLTSKLDILFLPFLKLDRFFTSSSDGIELVLKVEKIANCLQHKKAR